MLSDAMAGSKRFPWSRVNDYLLKLGSCRTVDELMRTAVSEAETVVPCDVAGIFGNRDGRWLEMHGTSQARVDLYNGHYRMVHPVFLAVKGELPDLECFVVHPVMRWDEHTDLEYASDFMLPCGCHQTLACGVAAHPIGLSLQRTRRAPIFSDADVTVVRLLDAHLSNFYTCLLGRNDPADRGSAVEQLLERFPCLSRRQAEVCHLVSRRLSGEEIATALLISRRTVERHLEEVFDKLDVRSRGQLRMKLAAASARDGGPVSE